MTSQKPEWIQFDGDAALHSINVRNARRPRTRFHRILFGDRLVVHQVKEIGAKVGHFRDWAELYMVIATRRPRKDRLNRGLSRHLFFAKSQRKRQ